MASVSPLQAFELGADAIYLSGRPLPTAPDGYYDWETTADAGLSPSNHSGLSNVLQEVCRP
jgi:linoleate 10R-lipoxygenase